MHTGSTGYAQVRHVNSHNYKCLSTKNKSFTLFTHGNTQIDVQNNFEKIVVLYCNCKQYWQIGFGLFIRVSSRNFTPNCTKKCAL